MLPNYFIPELMRFEGIQDAVFQQTGALCHSRQSWFRKSKCFYQMYWKILTDLRAKKITMFKSIGFLYMETDRTTVYAI